MTLPRFSALLTSIALAIAFSAVAQSGAAQNPGSPVSLQDSSTSDPELRSGRMWLGYGRLTTNDIIGDGEDRWQTGSITSSRVWGFGWDGAAPARLGDLLELRLQGRVMNGESVTRVDPDDRPWAGALSVGLHSHVTRGMWDYSIGGDVVVIGPQTNLDSLQKALHRIVNTAEPSEEVLDAQVADKVRPTLVAEAGRSYELSQVSRWRPFVEARAGDETYLRAGADLIVGLFGEGELLVRESVTGHRYRVIREGRRGTSWMFGIDTAFVADSAYLPDERGFELSDRRDRVRTGLHWQYGSSSSVFYGLTWLGEEFVGQDDTQLIGSLRLEMRF